MLFKRFRRCVIFVKYGARKVSLHIIKNHLTFYGNVESFLYETQGEKMCAYSAKKCTHGKTYEGYHKSRMSFQHLTREDLNLEQTMACSSKES